MELEGLTLSMGSGRPSGDLAPLERESGVSQLGKARHGTVEGVARGGESQAPGRDWRGHSAVAQGPRAGSSLGARPWMCDDVVW